MSGSIFSYLGWTFLPQLVTGWVQSFWYGFSIRAGDHKPQPGSPRYINDRRKIHILVIVAYLLYTVYEADWDIRRAGDFYRDLGVPLDVTDKALQSRFRRFWKMTNFELTSTRTVQYHPDKVSSSEARPAAEAYYVHLKLARDILSDPAKRFAYDRFGLDMIQWRHCTTVRDYVMTGVQTIAPYYVGGGLFMMILGFLGYLEWGRYWRYLTFISLALFEFHTITRPNFPAITTKIINPLFAALRVNHPPLLPFQTLVLARKLSITVFIALSQLGPLLQSPRIQLHNDAEVAQLQQLQRLEHISRLLDADAQRLLDLETVPFRGKEAEMGNLKGKLREWLVQNTIAQDPEVRDALGRVYARRREGAPGGARGTR